MATKKTATEVIVGFAHAVEEMATGAKLFPKKQSLKK